MRAHHCSRVVLTIAVLLSVSACGSTDTSDATSVGRQTTEATTTASDTDPATPAPEYDGNPGDILTLSNHGVTDMVVSYSSYEQLRDFSDTVVIATLTNTEVESSQPDPALSGTLLATFDVEEVVGGQNEPQPTARGLELVFPLDADPQITATVLDRIDPLLGQAQYLMFLNRALNGPAGETRYVATLSSGPMGLLAFWPGDGRLSPVEGQNDLAADAIRRGEELTGTTNTTPVLGEPTFDGPAPIGLTHDEVLRTFARPVGGTETEPPPGWDRYQDILDEALSE